MSDTNHAVAAPTSSRFASYIKNHPTTIELTDDVAELRCHFAEHTLGVVDRTCARMKLPTFYVGGVPYILRNKSLKIIAERGLRNAEPRTRTTRRRKHATS